MLSVVCFLCLLNLIGLKLLFVVYLLIARVYLICFTWVNSIVNYKGEYCIIISLNRLLVVLRVCLFCDFVLPLYLRFTFGCCFLIWVL